jgi:hypothetical protein
MTNLITNIDKCLLKWIWFNTNRRYKWHCCLLLFGVTNNRVYNDAFRTFTFSMQQSVSFTWPKKNQDNSFNFRFQIGNDRQSKRLLANLGRILFFSLLLFYWIKTGIQDFLLDIYSAYKSFVWTAALGLEFSGSNDIVLIFPLY